MQRRKIVYKNFFLKGYKAYAETPINTIFVRKDI